MEVPSGFDSRDCSLGQYCSRLSMKWIGEDGEAKEFVPNEKESAPLEYTLPRVRYENYISEKDWVELGKLLQSRYAPPLACTIASKANRLMEEGRKSYALIESVTALELAIDERIRTATVANSELQEGIQSFWQLPLPARLGIVASLIGVESGEIELVIGAVKERNKVVHDGVEPSPGIDNEIQATLRMVRSLLDMPLVRFPLSNTGNVLKGTADAWNKEQKSPNDQSSKA